MKAVTNECGSRNSFGYFDAKAREIVLRRPCRQKNDIDEALSWFDFTDDLKRVSIGIGAVENFVLNGTPSGQYSEARNVIKQSVFSTMQADNNILHAILEKLQNKKELRSLSLKCFIFTEDQELFDLLVKTIKQLSGSLVYLDLTGGYFTDEQLIDLADVIAKTHIAHMIWPEPRMSQMVLEQVMQKLSTNKSLVLMRSVPLELIKLATDNRQRFFDLGRKPSMIGDEEVRTLKEYENSVRLAIAHEKQVLMDLEKAIEAILA